MLNSTMQNTTISSCSYARDSTIQPGWVNSTMCPRFGLSVTLPGPTKLSTDTSTTKFEPTVTIEDASIVTTVSAIGNCTGDFTIGPCDKYPGVTITYEANHLISPLPFVVVVPGQCAKFNHEMVANQSALKTPCVGDPTITVDFALIGDYCKKYPASEHCKDFNSKATTPPSSGATSSQWKRSVAVVAFTVATVVSAGIL